MAKSKCPNQKCESLKDDKNTLFELREANFKSPFTYYFVQCSVCGTVIGIIDKHNTNASIDGLHTRINNLVNTSMLSDCNNEKIMEELKRQSHAINVIMMHLEIEG